VIQLRNLGLTVTKEFNLTDLFEALIDKLAAAGNPSLLAGIKRGIEKESLRVSSDGYLSRKKHPRPLGSALTHQYITTDYSEVLLEFITPPTSKPDEPLKDLEQIHRFVYQHLDNEYLWNASMPCMMDNEGEIPIAEYGSSNVGRMKHVYRLGLKHRYGSLMQTISGVHYNFSIPENLWLKLQAWQGKSGDLQSYISDSYMGLVRNFLRHGWMLPFLFGASPAVCNSFLKNKKTTLKALTACSSYGEFATSLRMGDMGYSNNAQSQLNISYNSLQEYVSGLETAINTLEPLYLKIGVKVEKVDNYSGTGEFEYRQLNANLLQIENEYYANIRPKRVTQTGERPANALLERGVEYIEVRGLDINPFSPLGISEAQIQWLDCFLLTCLLMPSAEISCREQAENTENLRRTVIDGRDTELQLFQDNRLHSIAGLGLEFSSKMKQVAQLLDTCWDTKKYTIHQKYC